MKNIFIILIATLFIALSSCKKEDDDPQGTKTYRLEFFRLYHQLCYQTDVRVEINGTDLGIIPTTSEGDFDAYEVNGIPFPIGAGYDVNLTDTYEIKFIDNQNDSLIGVAHCKITLDEEEDIAYIDSSLFESTPYIDQICTGETEIINLESYPNDILYVFLKMPL